MKLMEIIIFLIIFNLVMTGLAALSLTTGASYIEPGSVYDVGEYENVGATELIWSQISKNFLVSLGAGVAAGIAAHFLMGISGAIILSISIFAGLVSYGLVGTVNIFWNIYHSLTPQIRPAMGISLYMFLSIVGVLLALAVMQLLNKEVIA